MVSLLFLNSELPLVTYFGASTLKDIIDGKNDTIFDLSFSPDGLYLATESASSIVRVSSVIYDTNKSQACCY